MYYSEHALSGELKYHLDDVLSWRQKKPKSANQIIDCHIHRARSGSGMAGRSTMLML